MIGTRGILRGINQARDGRHLSVLASQATQATQASRSPVLPTASLLYQNPVVRRSIFTTRVLGDEVKVVVCPAFADSISEGDLSWERAALCSLVLNSSRSNLDQEVLNQQQLLQQPLLLQQLLLHLHHHLPQLLLLHLLLPPQLPSPLPHLLPHQGQLHH